MTTGIMDLLNLTFDSLGSIGTLTHVVHLPAIDGMIQPLADSLGLQLALLKYTVGLFAVYPFSAIMYAIPNKEAKHLCSIIVGFILMQWVFGPDWIHSFISAFGTYVICALGPKKQKHLIAFLWVMGYMTGSHAYRMYVSYLSGVFDFTGTQMVLTMKLTSFAFNLYDGTVDTKNVFPEQPHKDPKVAKLYADRARFAIRKLPSLLEFFGYVYCFTCILAGPAFEYNDYVQSIDGTTFLVTVVDEDTKKEKKVMKKPSNVLPALRRLLVGILCLVLHLGISAHYKLSSLYNPFFLAATSIPYRMMYCCVALLADRLKYYFAWKVAEGASILGGFGFEGYGKDQLAIGWKGVENIDIIGFETAANIQAVSRNWNKRTQGWLERYTYQRSGRSLVATYFISAFWHGLYPGFFAFFMSIPVMTNIERLAKQKINPLIVPGFDGYNLKTYPNNLVAKVYWVMSWFLTMVFVNYVVQPFSMGSLENTLTCLGSYYYLPHIVLFVTYGVLEILPKPKDKKEKSKGE